MKSDPANKLYYSWEKEKGIAVLDDTPRLNKEELTYWLYWLREQAKIAKIWSGTNDEIAYSQIVALIKSGNE